MAACSDCNHSSIANTVFAIGSRDRLLSVPTSMRQRLSHRPILRQEASVVNYIYCQKRKDASTFGKLTCFAIEMHLNIGKALSAPSVNTVSPRLFDLSYIIISIFT